MMEKYFEKFEAELATVEKKLDILNNWHVTNDQVGAVDISEDCRTTITNLWIEFHKLHKAYLEAEANHKEILETNIEHLLGELKNIDNESVERHRSLYKQTPHWLLFNFLDRAIQENHLADGITAPSTAIWFYLRGLIVKDLKEKGLL